MKCWAWWHQSGPTGRLLFGLVIFAWLALANPSTMPGSAGLAGPHLHGSARDQPLRPLGEASLSGASPVAAAGGCRSGKALPVGSGVACRLKITRMVFEAAKKLSHEEGQGAEYGNTCGSDLDRCTSSKSGVPGDDDSQERESEKLRHLIKLRQSSMVHPPPLPCPYRRLTVSLHAASLLLSNLMFRCLCA